MTPENERAGGLLLKTELIIRRYADGQMFAQDKPYSVTRSIGNVALSGGIAALWQIAVGAVTSTFHSGVARVGVGTCSGVVASNNQTGIQSALAYAAMDSVFPSLSGGCMAWQGTFAADQGNDAWNEFEVRNASGLGVGAALFRKVTGQGTKLSGQSWQLTAQVTMT